MGIEKPYGEALMAWAQGKKITMPGGQAKSANQRAQKAALELAIALQEGRHVPAAIRKAMQLFERQLENGHMALGRDLARFLNEIMIPGNHAPIWYAATGTLFELAWNRLRPRTAGVARLRVLTFQWWQHHLSLCRVLAVPAEAGSPPGRFDPGRLYPGSIVSPAARATLRGGALSYHRDAILRLRLGIPQVGPAKKRDWWTPRAPDLVGPFWFSSNLSLMPKPEQIGKGFLPRVHDPLDVRRCTEGHTGVFPEGITEALDPLPVAWAADRTWTPGFGERPPAPPCQGMLVEEIRVPARTRPDRPPRPSPP